jgi:hypothetical protein
MSLDALIAQAVSAVLREQLPELLADLTTPDRAPALLDRHGLARALSCSTGTIDKMRRQGMPEVRLGDSPRFDLDDVIRWLKRQQP